MDNTIENSNAEINMSQNNDFLIFNAHKILYDEAYDKMSSPEDSDALVIHSQTVSDEVRKTGASEKAVALAFLHDVVEDCCPEDMTHEEYLTSLKLEDEELEEALLAISRRPGEIYMEYIDRMMQNDLARTVKVCDLLVNLKRCLQPDTTKPGLHRRYLKALRKLGDQKFPPKNGIDSAKRPSRG